MPAIQRPQISLAEIRTVVELVNPKKGSFTCVGTAISKGRRCENCIAKENRDIAEDIVQDLPLISQSRSELKEELYELAKRALCRRYHQNQALEVAQDWYEKIRRIIDRRSRSPSPRRSDRPRRTSGATSVTIISTTTTSITTTSTTITSSAATSAGINSTTETSSTPPALPGSDSVPDTQSNTLRPAEQHNHEHDAETNDSTHTDEDNECPICSRDFEDPCRTPCGHKFCRECISDWLQHNETCPFDRRPLQVGELITIEVAPAEDSLCGICWDPFVAPCRTPCGHTFCRGCISTWLETAPRGTCPLDRRPLEEDDLVSVATS